MREVQTTAAHAIPNGAELIGGDHDGARVKRVLIQLEPPHAARCVLVLECGCEVPVLAHTELSWLTPINRTARR